MPDTVAQRLAVAAVWPVAVQRLLIASPDLRDALVVNEHLDPDVVDTLANTSTPTGLRRLIQSQRHGVDGMRACLRHAHEMFGPATPDGSEEIDFEVAWALLHGDGPERVRALDAALATARTGHSTAEVRYAARVDRPAVELVADMELHERALWLASPAAADLSDPVVWELLKTRFGDVDPNSKTAVQRIAAVLFQRPRLRKPDRETSSDRAIGMARALLDLTDLRSRVDEEDRADQVEFILNELHRPRRRNHAIPNGVPQAPWILAQLADRDWTPKERARLVPADHDKLVDSLGYLAPRVAEGLGFKLTRVGRLYDQFTWDGMRRISPDIDRFTLDNPAEHLVGDVTPETATAATSWLQAQLDVPDDELTAARWQVVLRTAERFSGTLGDLAATASAICAPAA